MKAIQIKILLPTEFKPTRLKAFTHAGSIIEAYDYNGLDPQAHALAQRYVKHFFPLASILGSGVLPNGDWVFTLKPRSDKA